MGESSQSELKPNEWKALADPDLSSGESTLNVPGTPANRALKKLTLNKPPKATALEPTIPPQIKTELQENAADLASLADSNLSSGESTLNVPGTPANRALNRLRQIGLTTKTNPQPPQIKRPQ